MNNQVTFFRYGNKFYDVFIEDDHYLYAEATPWNRAYYLSVRDYKILDNDLLVGTYSGADTEYLQNLKPAPHDVASEIIGNEIRLENLYSDDHINFEDMTNKEIFEYLENC